MLNLSGQDTTSTLHAVCFNGKLFSKFEASSTYDFQQFKLKKSVFNSAGKSVVNSADEQMDESLLKKLRTQ